MLGMGTVNAVDTVTHYAQPSGYYYGESGTYTWIDECPLCGAHDCLSWNPKSARPGEWSCLTCGVDYDGTNGEDKAAGGSRGTLIRYVPEPEPTVAENATVQPVPTPLEIAHKVLISNSIL